ncbi:MAG: helix-hairpin-helix domain-containing protein [Patescibacteria group bacterium]
MPSETSSGNISSWVSNHFRVLCIFLSFNFLFGSGLLLAKVWDYRKNSPLRYQTVESGEFEKKEEGEGVNAVAQEISVHVSGAVSNSGVYQLPEGSRVEDAIRAAGGFSSAVDKDWVDKGLNLAALLSDGQKIYVQKEGEKLDRAVSGLSTSTQAREQPSAEPQCPAKINLNTASVKELECLNGIGEKKAAAIVNYRSQQRFSSIEEVMEVKGIAEGIFSKIKDQITAP